MSVYTVRLGTRRILGADHPVEIVVSRKAKNQWIAARICNGICEFNWTFTTRAQAIAYAKTAKDKERWTDTKMPSNAE